LRPISRHIRSLKIFFDHNKSTTDALVVHSYDFITGSAFESSVKYKLTAMSDLRLTSSASSVRKSLEPDDFDMACGLGNGAKYFYRSNAVPAQNAIEDLRKPNEIVINDSLWEFLHRSNAKRFRCGFRF